MDSRASRAACRTLLEIGVNDRTRIQCGGHGEAYATVVCEHLLNEPAQEWFGAYPEEDYPWPDAWCAKCDAIFLREGEWNERTEVDAPFKIICSSCYEDARSRSVDRLEGDERARWDDFVGSCCVELQRKQEKLIRESAFDRHERWDWDLDIGRLVFSTGGVPGVVTAFECVGSVSTVSNTWLWSWANFSIRENVRSRIIKVRDMGESEQFPRLTTAKWSATEHDGWHMAAVAARLLGAVGAYRVPVENGFWFLALMSARKA